MADQPTITVLRGLGMAAIMARKGHDAAAVGAALAAPIGDEPRVSHNGDLAIVGTGPGAWLAVMPDASPRFADDLADRLDGVASVSDQSGAYVVTRLSGPAARTILQRGMAIDLHPDRFAFGAVASTVIAHVAVIVWQVDDAPTYDIATFRSYAGSFRYWLDRTAASL